MILFRKIELIRYVFYEVLQKLTKSRLQIIKISCFKPISNSSFLNIGEVKNRHVLKEFKLTWFE